MMIMVVVVESHGVTPVEIRFFFFVTQFFFFEVLFLNHSFSLCLVSLYFYC